MPYPEWKSWYAFSLVEPFGWHNDEYHTAAVLSILYNINRGKKKAKSPTDFMRDPVKELYRQVAQEKINEAMRRKLENASPEEKKRMIAAAFGGMVGDGNVKVE